jgi:predicted outer membrane repeat protein
MSKRPSLLSASRRAGTRLRCEQLEEREVPATFIVTNNLDDGSAGSLREVIAQTNANVDEDLIQFDSSLAGQTIVLTQGQLTLAFGTKTVIDGSALSSPIVISGNNATRVFNVAGGVPKAEFKGLIITGGNTTGVGGGILSSGTTKIIGCTLINNAATSGGAIYSVIGTLLVENSTITANTATNSGGGIQANDSNSGLTVNGCTITANSAGTDGGGINNRGGGVEDSTISNCVIVGNSAAVGGGINGQGFTIISGSTISNNSAGLGGGIFGASSITGCNIFENLATSSGGGICGVTNLSGSNIFDNSATSGGGVDGAENLTDCNIFGNSAIIGGGLNNGWTVTGCTFAGNTAESGGGIHGANSVSGSSFVGNIATELGGGIYTVSGGTVMNCTFSGNLATDGGAIYSVGGTYQQFAGDGTYLGEFFFELTVNWCTLSGNSASSSGGGVYNDPLGVLRITNASAVNGNQAPSGADVENFGTLDIQHSAVGSLNDQNPGSTTINIAASDTATSLTASVDAEGQIVFNARVLAADDGAGTPTGTVTLYKGGTAMGTQTLVDGEAVFSGPALVTGASPLHAVYSGDGSFSTSASAKLIQVVPALAPGNLQTVVDSLPSGNATAVNLHAATEASWQAAVAAINTVISDQPITVVLNVGSGPFSGLTYDNSDPDVSFVLNGSEVSGGTIVYGGSPALRVLAGKVAVTNITFTTPTDDPTVLVTGGSLTLRDCAVQESTGFDNAAIEIIGGSLDLGTEASPGGNAINVNGTGEALVNLGTEPVSTVGTTFLVDGRAIATVVVTGGSFIFDGQPHPATGSVIGVNGENLGTPTFTYSFTDNDGNAVTSASSPVNPGYYTVTASFAGNDEYNPAVATATIMIAFEVRTLTDLSRVFNAGRTIPIKLQLLDANGNNVSSPEIDLTAIRLERVNSDGSRTMVSLQDAGNSNPDNLFRYNAGLGGYIFNLSTRGLGEGTYYFYWMAEGDPTEHELTFQLR